ncbi:ABC transporter transmembrane domain-containing protein, partial [Acinetobacter baumannii]|nr:ABC transporter transmembrane domain-containing protein [Acinetobacter baumannii]
MTLINHIALLNVICIWQYIFISIFTLLLMYILLSNEYINLYNTTSKESANLRKDIAKSLSNIPIAYFSKNNLSDLSHTIMSDVADIEHALSHSIPKVLGLYLFFPLMGFIMLIGNWKLGLAVIIPTLLSFIILPLSKKKRISANSNYFNVLR